jgi:hypothetical protein
MMGTGLSYSGMGRDLSWYRMRYRIDCGIQQDSSKDAQESGGLAD